MGSFKGHALPGTMFLAVGLWHMWSTVVRYVSDPTNFRVRIWNPVPGFNGKLYHLELYLVTGGAFLDMCIELLYSTHLKIIVDGELNPSHLNDFEHGGMLLMFFLFGLAALLSQKTLYLPMPDGALFFLAATAFLSEYLLFYFHSTNHKGLEGYYHLFLVLLIGVCTAATITAALVPTSFAVDLAASIAITLQGLWFYQTAFTLYGPMMPKGCRLNDGQVLCQNSDEEIRGMLIANCQFFALVLGIFVLLFALYGLAVSRYAHDVLQFRSYVVADSFKEPTVGADHRGTEEAVA